MERQPELKSRPAWTLPRKYDEPERRKGAYPLVDNFRRHATWVAGVQSAVSQWFEGIPRVAERLLPGFKA
jgi:hypothetical protein